MIYRARTYASGPVLQWVFSGSRGSRFGLQQKNRVVRWKKVRREIIGLLLQVTNHRDLHRTRHCYRKRITIPTRIRYSNLRWEELEKQPRAVFEERTLGRVVRRTCTTSCTNSEKC